MNYRELDTVVVARDLPLHGLRRGDVGAVVHVHSADCVEVEFVTATGLTQSVVMLAGDDIRPVCDRDLLAVRRLDAA
jgi:hypothetical protein